MLMTGNQKHKQEMNIKIVLKIQYLLQNVSLQL